jgi:DNA-binding Lrp family transcriptional regulator
MKDVADQVLIALQNAGTAGLHIKELADRLGIDSKEVSSAIEMLIKKGLIMQKTTDNDEYMIKSSLTGEAESGSLSDMNGCPCYHCLKISRCGIRQPDSPVTCNELQEWMASATR